MDDGRAVNLWAQPDEPRKGSLVKFFAISHLRAFLANQRGGGVIVSYNEVSFFFDRDSFARLNQYYIFVDYYSPAVYLYLHRFDS